MIGRPVRLGRGDEGGEHQQMKSRDQAGGDLGGHGKDFDSYSEKFGDPLQDFEQLHQII